MSLICWNRARRLMDQQAVPAWPLPKGWVAGHGALPSGWKEEMEACDGGGELIYYIHCETGERCWERCGVVNVIQVMYV